MAVVDGLQRLPGYAHRRRNRNPTNRKIDYFTDKYMAINLDFIQT